VRRWRSRRGLNASAAALTCSTLFRLLHRYKIYRQQFLELIEASESQKAFNLLLRRIKPLEYYAQDAGEFRELSYLLSARSVAEAPRFASWGGAVDGREELVEGLRAMGGGGAFGKKIATGQAPSSASPAAAASASYVPEGRLVALLRQAVAWQVHSARYPSKILPAISSVHSPSLVVQASD
jgi:COMPASS component SWD3